MSQNTIALIYLIAGIALGVLLTKSWGWYKNQQNATPELRERNRKAKQYRQILATFMKAIDRAALSEGLALTCHPNSTGGLIAVTDRGIRILNVDIVLNNRQLIYVDDNAANEKVFRTHENDLPAQWGQDMVPGKRSAVQYAVDLVTAYARNQALKTMLR